MLKEPGTAILAKVKQSKIIPNNGIAAENPRKYLMFLV
jgi:hypothetical protein